MFLYLNLNNPKRETKFNTIPRGFGKLKHTLHENVINRFCQGNIKIIGLYKLK